MIRKINNLKIIIPFVPSYLLLLELSPDKPIFSEEKIEEACNHKERRLKKLAVPTTFIFFSIFV